MTVNSGSVRGRGVACGRDPLPRVPRIGAVVPGDFSEEAAVVP
ncbi:hypothetical protein [Novispirillum itersonii]|nr:hypothetical protein [Novispirillum itersonii]